MIRSASLVLVLLSSFLLLPSSSAPAPAGDLIARYKTFVDSGKTPFECVTACTAIAAKEGFSPLETAAKIVPGGKYFIEKSGKSACYIIAGRRPALEGVRIVAGHIDSVRIDLKPNPLYESEGFGMFDTISYGGMKNYQWVNLPLALHAKVVRPGGKVEFVVIGEREEDPVLIIPDLLPHLDSSLRTRTQRDVIKAEELDPIGATSLAELERILREKHGVSREDLQLGEFRLVPALKCRDVGLDAKLLAGYGHDDKACSFAAFEGLRTMTAVPDQTAIAYLVEQEESGSTGTTGARSEFLRRTLALLVEKSEASYNEQLLRKCLVASRVLCADVTGGIDPIWGGVHDPKNGARLSKGLVIKRYGRGKDSNAEFYRELVDLLKAKQLSHQVCMLGKVDEGGGGTIAPFLTDMELETIDVGIPELAMHSPYSVVHKDDLATMTAAFTAFYGAQ